jgi:hypothetical protein
MEALTAEQEQTAAQLIERLHAALTSARLSASVRVAIGADGEPKLQVSSTECGERREAITAIVGRVLAESGNDHRYTGPRQ